MASFRNILFQIHLWVGLIAGIFFILLGLSGSALVYPNLLQPRPTAPKATAQGTPLPLEQVIDAARAASPGSDNRTANVTLPRHDGDAVTVQFQQERGAAGGGRRGGRRGGRGGRRGAPGANGAMPAGQSQGRDGEGRGGRGPEGGRGGNGPQIYVDPVSGQVLGTQVPVNSPLVGLAHQMHEAMLLGGPGRTLVAWLGVGMFFLGLSGIVLWWPKPGQWRFAFGVRRTAKGLRFYREVHGMFGIWFWIIFLFVTATSLPLGFPRVMRMIGGQAQGPGGDGGGRGGAQQVQVVAPDGAERLPLAQLIADAQKAGGTPVSISVPAQQGQPVMVNFADGQGEGQGRGVAVNPFTGELLQSPARPSTGLDRRLVEQLHGGGLLGPVWKFLVFLSGFLPLIFVATGLMMWLKKREVQREAVARRAG